MKIDLKRLYELMAYSINKEGDVALCSLIGEKNLTPLMNEQFFIDFMKKASVADKSAAAKKKVMSLSKGGLATLCALYLTKSEENRINFLANLPDEVIKTMKLCAKNYVVLTNELSHTIREKILTEDRYGYSRIVSPKFEAFFNSKRIYSSYHQNFALTLNELSIELFSDYLEMGTEKVNETFTPDPRWRIYTTSKDIFLTIESCKMLIKRDSITPWILPMASICRKIAPIAGIDEIFTSGEKIWKWWRTATMIFSLSTTMSSKSGEGQLRNAVYWLLDTQKKNGSYLVREYYLPHLKGFGYSLLPNVDNITDLALNSLRELSKKMTGWIPFDLLMKNIRISATSNSEFIGYVEAGYHKDILRVGKYDEIPYPLLYRYISEPVAKMVLFIFGSFGLADLVIDDSDSCTFSYYDPIRGVRLTPLGRYILGLTESFELSSEKTAEYEIFEDRLVVRCVSKEKVADTLLTDVMEPLGGGRYVMTEASFLKNCRSGIEIDSKISFFKSVVSPKNALPDIWQDFFKKVKAKSGGLSACSLATYVLYKIDPSRKDLLQAFSTDSYILAHTIKVEGYKVLIEKNHLSIIFAKLRSLGFLIDT